MRLLYVFLPALALGIFIASQHVRGRVRAGPVVGGVIALVLVVGYFGIHIYFAQ